MTRLAGGVPTNEVVTALEEPSPVLRVNCGGSIPYSSAKNPITFVSARRTSAWRSADTPSP